MKPDFSKEPNRLLDPYWRKARIAARQRLKREPGQPWSSRDQQARGAKSREDNEAANWLLDQA